MALTECQNFKRNLEIARANIFKSPFVLTITAYRNKGTSVAASKDSFNLEILMPPY